MAMAVDGHVHTEGSWDARDGSLERTCVRARELGMPGIVVTEHLDASPTVLDPEDLSPALQPLLGPDGVVHPPGLDVDRYLAEVERCRAAFPDLRIVAGVELGDGHRAAGEVAELLRGGRFGRVLGSLHSVPVDGRFLEPPVLFRAVPAEEGLRAYLAELCRMVEGCDAFDVLAHIDFPLRFWPEQGAPFDAAAVEDDFRRPLRLLAGSGRALEVSTKVPLPEPILGWWVEEGGRAITLGSDAHEPEGLGRGFPAAEALVRRHGFAPAARPEEPWTLLARPGSLGEIA